MTKKYPKRWRHKNFPTPKELQKLCQGLDISIHEVFVEIIRNHLRDTKREIVWRRKRSS